MDYNPFSLKGKQILVTGASSGIGRAIAVDCARMGASVSLTARNEQRLQETLSLLPDGSGTVVRADLTLRQELECLVEQLPPLDGVVHVAGVGSCCLCKNITEHDIHHVVGPNLTAPLLLQAKLLQSRKVKKNASIAYIASKAATSPSIGNAVYSASKAALVSYAKCLALELAPRKIRVNCVCPAMVWTDLILQEGVDREILEENEKKYPLGRYGQPEDIAPLVVYLMSDASTWMTGSALEITGGAQLL